MSRYDAGGPPPRPDVEDRAPSSLGPASFDRPRSASPFAYSVTDQRPGSQPQSSPQYQSGRVPSPRARPSPSPPTDPRAFGVAATRDGDPAVKVVPATPSPVPVAGLPEEYSALDTQLSPGLSSNETTPRDSVFPPGITASLQPSPGGASSDSTHDDASTSILLPTQPRPAVLPPQQPPSTARTVTWVPDQDIARPITGRSASGRPETAETVNDLPDRQFFSEDDEEDDEDEEEPSDNDDNVFAFQHPTSDQKAVHQARHEIYTPPGWRSPDPPGSYQIDEPETFGPQIGVLNQNKAAFKHWRQRRPQTGASSVHSTTVQAGAVPTLGMRPNSANRPPPPTATSTAMTSSAPSSIASDRDEDHGHRSFGGPGTGRPKTADTVGTTMSDDYTETTDDSESRDGRRHSYVMTELSGDPTVPDGRTTWGDGIGGAAKESTDGGDGQYDVDPDWLEEDSPYAEVRASVSNIDDPEMPALTIRAFALGMFLSIVGSAANTFFSMRNPTPVIPILVMQIAAYPMGRFLAWVLPIRDWTLPRWLGGVTFNLNPCPFNIKEHTIIVMMANVSIVPAYGLNTLIATEKWYKREFGPGFNFLYIIATQLTGLSMAGVVRRFVVWPASMIWPGILVSTTNLNTLHADTDMGTGGMSRLRFFLIMGGAAFAWYFLPGFLFSALSYFSWACWIAPRNLVVNQLFGINTGLGMGLLAFDWSQIAWIGSPLVAPWWAQVNFGIGFLIFYWTLVPGMYYTNTWFTKYLPITAIQPADRFQQVYNVTRILTTNFELDKDAYRGYSPVYLTATFSTTYMLAFGLTTSLIVYTILYHGPRIWMAMRQIKTEADDIHLKLMMRYPEVPDWWYLVSFVLCLVIGIITVEVFSTGLPVWGYLLSVAMAAIYVVPTAIIYAMTSIEPAFNLIAELIPGYMFAGRPIPGLIFKTFAVQTLSEAMSFARDMKLGHYMKVPPRAMFICQFAACGCSAIIQVGVKIWMFKTIPDLCADKQKDLLVCSNAKTSFTASVIWGLIGPARLFDKGGVYRPQLWMLFVGAVIPIPIWLWVRKWPKSVLRNLNVSVVFSVCLSIPPATGINIASFLVVGFIFQFWVRRHAFAWWAKYNYVLSAALDSGTLTSAIFIFLVLRLPGAYIDWWGNNVYTKTLDWVGSAFIRGPAEGFGPSTWKV